ncbi:hypothetical protein KY290_021015 [Solanum tuberosum]|uniref:Uncharacterized protein n=1 Tax=Solanum tuberosum TaxID=4113 RepID=A0ABQ7V2B5_SOLTU|nr:hypothetical protein KY289_020200 [Solanum tuberosum]KAH0692863.1 hypothetical protein KY285_019960 [Solanum tuberosum]KAH0757522.1 hypothetical protein KY290_021015 [Solanum tuberosum]
MTWGRYRNALNDTQKARHRNDHEGHYTKYKKLQRDLELSNTCFLWVTRQNVIEHLAGLEDRVKNRALIVKERVDQNEVLNHKSIKGFLSHCGWNSILESICAKVPVLALPFMAEQHLNARMVTEEIGVGLRIMPRNGSVREFVEAEQIEKMVRELMEGEKGEMVRKNWEKMHRKL